VSLYRRKNSPYYWCRITLPGVGTVQESTRTADPWHTQEWADRRRAELWRQSQFGERPVYRWEEAVLKWLAETAHKRDHAGDRQRLAAMHEALEERALNDITHDRLSRCLAKLSRLKTPGARNRYRTTVRAILRKAEREWEWIDRAPVIRLEPEPKSAGR